jgi:hypothetical protein
MHEISCGVCIGTSDAFSSHKWLKEKQALSQLFSNFPTKQATRKDHATLIT